MNKIMKHFLLILILITIALTAEAQNFEETFEDKTLRVDYIFTGNQNVQMVSLSELSEWELWAGKRENLDSVPLKGNGDVVMKDISTGEILFKNSFSSLFQEWLGLDEAKTLTKSFEATFLLPFPKNQVDVIVTLYDVKGSVATSFSHRVNPSDILIRDLSLCKPTPYEYVVKSGNPNDKIDVAIVAEGYTDEEMDLFMKDAQRSCEALFSYEPFASSKDKFNVIAVKSVSEDTNVSIPHENLWRKTAVNSNFDTFYAERYLTVENVHLLNDVLSGIPFEHIIILANTDTYGGGGIYNSYTMTTAHHELFAPVIVHEFGHSFGGLADEYFYEKDDIVTAIYTSDSEPWEQNITTLFDFESKWKDMLPEETQIPTEPTDKAEAEYITGVYEGGGYLSKGVYRPAVVCRMRNNTATQFCPVCQRSLQRIIDFYAE